MSTLAKYNAANLDQLMDRITRNSLGMDNYFDRLLNVSQNVNYPPYNVIQLDDNKVKLEVALAGFSKKDLDVYTETGKLVIEGKKENTESNTYIHQGLAKRSFTRAWTISEDTEVTGVNFEDGLLTVYLSKIVPDHHKKKVWL